jgi:uncharacterized protein YgiB involved in biofilm formation
MLACAQRVSGKGQPKQITNAIKPCEASILSFFPPRSGFVQQEIAAGNAGWPVQFRFREDIINPSCLNSSRWRNHFGRSKI